MRGPLAAFAAAIACASCSGGAKTATPAAVRADLMIVNARVYTGDPARPWAESIAIRGDRIVEATAAARVIDAGGRVVIPGINDAHVHAPDLPADAFVEAAIEGHTASPKQIIVHNPSHYTLPDLMRGRLGPRLDGWFLSRDVIAAGIPFAFGSDGPLNPWLNILFATTRPDDPAQALTREQALAAYTTGSAFDERLERDKGRLVPGMLADLAVLSADPFTAAPDALPALHSELTLVGGAIVHDSGALTPAR